MYVNDVKSHSVEMSHLLTFSVMGITINFAVCSAGMNGYSVFLSCDRDMRLRQTTVSRNLSKRENQMKRMNLACSYCDEPFIHDEQVVTVCYRGWMYLFCSISCRDFYGFQRHNKRICNREVCNNRVAEGNRMLCSSCYQRGNHLGEPEVSFGEAERAHWERIEQALHRRIEEKVRVYSSKDMSQEELRALVPSMHEEAA